VAGGVAFRMLVFSGLAAGELGHDVELPHVPRVLPEQVERLRKLHAHDG
jgi:hypothetical protein